MFTQLALSAAFGILFVVSSGHGTENVHSVDLEHMAKRLRGDVRLIAMGDSYSSPFIARVPIAALRVWPIEHIAALGSGATTSSHTFICSHQCGPVAHIKAEDPLGYTIERNTAKTFFTLPVLGVQEIYTSASFDDQGNNRLFEFKQSSSGKKYLSNGMHGVFAEEVDELNFRLLYRCPSDLDKQLPELKILDNLQDVGITQLRNGVRPLWHLGENPALGTRQAIPRQINASGIDYPANNNAGGLLTMRLEQLEPLAGTNQYFEPAGCVYYHVDEKGEREKGLFFSSIADGSWSYSGFGSDAEGENAFDKNFSLEQFTYWLDVTTLDREQPTVFMWFLAPEQLSYQTSLHRMINMMNQADESAKRVGLTTVEHLIVIGSLFSLTGDLEVTREFIRNQQRAAFDLANALPHVSAASLFAATDEVLLSGNSGISWLLYKGFDQFEFGSNNLNLIEETNGNLFDQWGIHPASGDAAAFFASLLGEIIRDAGCIADVVPDGLINTTDLLSIISHIGEGDVEQDINEDGIVNILDLLFVIDGWGDCWPVQAPYNTPAFRSSR